MPRPLTLPAFLAVLCLPASGQSQKLSLPLAPSALAEVVDLEVSASGGRAVFEIRSPAGPWSLHIVPADGSGPARAVSGHADLSRSTGDWSPFGDPVQFTPDESRLVFWVGSDAGNELWWVPSDGSAPAQRIETGGLAGFEKWGITPDGERIVLIDTFALYVLPIDGGAPPRLLGPVGPGAAVLDFEVAPDGTRVVFRKAYASNTGIGLHTVPLDGSAPDIRLQLVRTRSEVQDDYVVSNDSLGVVYRHDAAEEGRHELFVTRIDGSTLPLRRDASESVRWFALTPNDQRLVYAADGVFSVPTFAGAAVPLSPPFYDWRNPELTPSGVRLVYLRDGELYSTLVDGSAPPVELSTDIADGEVSNFRMGPNGTVVYQLEGGPLLAVPATGGASPVEIVPSAGAYVLDPTGSRVVFQHALFQYALGRDTRLFSAPLDASAAAVELTGIFPLAEPFSYPFVVAGAGVLYLARQERADARELFRAPLSGGVRVRLSPALPDGVPLGDVVEFDVAPDATRLVYTANQAGGTRRGLYQVEATGGVAVERSAPVRSDEAVLDPRITATGEHVVFRTQDLTRALQSVALDGGAPPVPIAPPLEFSIQSSEVSPDGRAVAFHAAVIGSSDVYVGPADGSTPATLLPRPGDTVPAQPRFSSDGLHVAYALVDGDGAAFEIFTAPADGAGLPVPLTAPHVRERLDPLVAVGATRLLFAGDLLDDGQVELRSVPIDGSAAPVRLNPDAHFPRYGDIDVSFTPDETHAVFTAQRGSVISVFVAPADGSAPARDLGRAVGPVASPDSTTVVFWSATSSPGIGTFTLHAAAIDGTSPPHVLASLVAAPSTSTSLVAITPDSTRVVFTVPSARRLYSVGLDGSGLALLSASVVPGAGLFPGTSSTAVSRDEVFQLTPDGRGVVFAADLRELGTWELFHAPLDGSASPRVVSGALPPGGDALGNGRPSFRISPRGDRVFYLADEETDGVVELFASPLRKVARRAPSPEITHTR
jgi:hypothetical protein